MTTETRVDLFDWLRLRFCDPDHPKLRRPFWIDRRIVFTDGRILAALDSPDPPDDFAAVPAYIMGQWHGVEGNHKPIDPRPVLDLIHAEKPMPHPPQVDGPLDHWGPLWQAKARCEECDGDGYVRCNYDHVHDCEECDGVGMAEGVVEGAYTPVLYGKRKYQRRYLWICSQLPNVKFYEPAKNGTEAMMAFSFSGGVGCIMAMSTEV